MRRLALGGGADEDGFGEVELAGDGLHALVVQAGRVQHDGKRIAGELLRCKNVERVEAAGHARGPGNGAGVGFEITVFWLEMIRTFSVLTQRKIENHRAPQRTVMVQVSPRVFRFGPARGWRRWRHFDYEKRHSRKSTQI